MSERDPQMRWLRLWVEVLDDPKLLLLAAEDRWYYIAILALKRTGIIDEPDTKEMRDRKISLRLRLDNREQEEIKRRLCEVRLIDENWQPLGWEKRQYSSDLSTNRVKRFRKRHRKRSGNDTETFQKRSRNAPEQSRDRAEELISSKNKNSSRRSTRAHARRCPPDFEPDREFALSQLPELDAEAEVLRFRDHEFDKPKSDWGATWRNWIRTCRDRGQYARKGAASASAEQIRREIAQGKRDAAGNPIMFGGKQVEWK